MIAECLIPNGRPAYTGKEDLKPFALTCKTLRSAAISSLFGSVTITLSVTDEMPRGGQPWRPLRWKTPVFHLQSSELRTEVKNLRLRILPCPSGRWTEERYDDVMAPLKQYRDDPGPLTDMLAPQDLTTFSLDAHPHSERGRQTHVCGAYYTLLLQHCVRANKRSKAAWTEDAAPLLRPIILQLPNWKHMEAVAPGIPEGFFFATMAMSYADRLILRLAPPTMCSFALRSWPQGLADANAWPGAAWEDRNSVTHSGLDWGNTTLVQRKGQLTLFAITCNNTFRVTLSELESCAHMAQGELYCGRAVADARYHHGEL